MSILQKATQETKKLFLDEEKTEFLEVLVDLSKRQFNTIVGFMPGKISDEPGNMTVAQATDFQKVLFTELVVGWSLDEPTTGETYDALTADAGNAIDTALSEHFASLNPGKAESKAPSTSRGSSPKG